MIELSPERVAYHEMIERFVKIVSPGGLIYDIGKSDHHNYSKILKGFEYKSVDKDKSKQPDILFDVEGHGDLPAASGLLFNGVIEQCDDPVKMLNTIRRMIKPGGHALLGMVLLGYPPLTIDKFRFTELGVMRALNLRGFEIIERKVVKRNDVPSYIYAICQRT